MVSVVVLARLHVMSLSREKHRHRMGVNVPGDFVASANPSPFRAPLH